MSSGLGGEEERGVVTPRMNVSEQPIKLPKYEFQQETAIMKSQAVQHQTETQGGPKSG